MSLPMALVLVQVTRRRAASTSSRASPEDLILLSLPVNFEVVGLLRYHVYRVATICITAKSVG